MNIEIKSINSRRLIKLFIAASRWLARHTDVLNDLNVYPVPDGDTGSNMAATMQAIENQLLELDHEPKMVDLVEDISEAVLLGARGNSGTILSQVVQGFLSELTKDEVFVEDAIRGLQEAKKRVYEAVSNPVEGTMLTVVRRVAEEALKYDGPKDDFVPFLEFIKNVADETVEDTPNHLEKLREAGVVDAGGKGIYYILEGFEMSYAEPEVANELERVSESLSTRKDKLSKFAPQENPEDIEFKYCTEFIIQSGDFDLNNYRDEVSKHGDSLVCAQTAKKTKTHIHTNNPGLVLEIAGTHGNLDNIKIENMAIQHSNLLNPSSSLASNENPNIIMNDNCPGMPSMLAIVDTPAMAEVFLKSGAAGVLIGGQSNNPSVLEIEELINGSKLEKVILLPNNKNIIAAAELAASRSSKNVSVISTTSILEGLFLIKNRHYEPTRIAKAVQRNISIEVTQAVRDTTVNKLTIKEGDFIAIINGKIAFNNEKLEDLVAEVYHNYVNEDILSILVARGQKVIESEAPNLLEPVRVKYEEIDTGQENYHYYIYLELKDPELPEVAIVTDSTSDLSKVLIGNLPLNIIPMKAQISGSDKYYKDGVDLTRDDFWKNLLDGNGIPKTSQPSPAEFKEMYERLFDMGYKKIISIHISSSLSGVQHAAGIGRSLTGRENDIAIIDSKTVTFALGHLALEATRLAEEGRSFEDIISWLNSVRNNIELYFTVRDLKFLTEGGRVSKTGSIAGEAFKLKPILKLENGQICTEKKVIGKGAALRHIEKIVKKKAQQSSIILYTGWGGCKDELDNADHLRMMFDENSRIEYRGRAQIGCAIGTHTGPVYGVVIIPKLI